MNSKLKSFLTSRYILLVLSILMIWTGGWFYHSEVIKVNKDKYIDEIESVISSQDNLARDLIEETKRHLNENSGDDIYPTSFTLFSRISEEDPMSLLVFRNKELLLWSDNQVPYELPEELESDHPVKRLRNGWYRIIKDEVKDFTIIAVIKIRNEFQYRNRYLSNTFIPAYNLPESAKLSVIPEESDIRIKDADGKYLFGVVFEEKNIVSETGLLFIALYVLAGIILLIVFLRMECVSLEKFIGPFNASLLLVFTLGILRYWSLAMEFPGVFYEFGLFKPEQFAASFFLPSLGDFLINALLILYIFYFLDSRSNNFVYRYARNKAAGIWITILLTSLIYLYAFYIGELLQGLIEDSNIEFNINNIFNLSVYSFVGFSIIGLLFFSFYLLCEFMFRVSKLMNITKSSFLLIWIAISIVSVSIQHSLGIRDLIIVLWPAAVIFILFVAFYLRGEEIAFNYTVLLLITFSAFSAHSLSKFTFSKENKNRLVLAGEKLLTDEDPLAEILYSDIEPKLLKSEILNNVFDPQVEFSKEKFEQQLEEEFFTGDLNKFDIQFYLFAKDSTPIGLEGFAPVREFSDFEKIINQHGISSQFNKNMYFIYNSTNKLSYIIRLPVKLRNDEPKGFLFCELRSKKIPEDIGFPELLIDKTSSKVDVIHQYSYARYVDSVQVHHFGTYRYSLLSSHYMDFPGKFEFRNEGGFNHLFYKVDNRTLIILSRPLEKFINKATTFSYLFTLFCIILILGFVTKQIATGNATIQFSMRGKVQLMLGGVLLISLVLFGLGTRYFIADQYKEKNYNIISEKSQSVRIEVMGKFATETKLTDELKNYIGYILTRFSNVFLTDINMFDTEGKLIASSRPKIFQAGLVSEYMNPEAYYQMVKENKSEFIQEEKIGEMTFLSSYVPLLNDDNKILGFLNLPYFARQSALESELSSFLVAILNIFVVLFALSLLAALFVSNWITKPLRLVQESLASIQLGKTNKPIEYSGSDEIGSLVEEYNKKVAELEKYATELARSERESAWREMAKQVAHEIKNPLTPMRLSIQHMQRSLKPEDPNWDEKLSKFASTLIEQIDALSNIANEFSNFAKMPRAKEEQLDLIQILENTLELYRETPGVKFRLNIEPGEAKIFADKDQILRVFNNLVKNAIQAIPDDRQGKIDISLKRQKNDFIVEIKDNGSGIAPDRIDKIFLPNFTTKSTGMGLGLAMVKNIVENTKGKIWFETSQGTGTSFYVSLPEKV